MLSNYFRLSALIVADDPMFARLMTLMLERIGFERIGIVPDLARLRGRQTYLRHDLIVADGELAAQDCSDLLLEARIDPLLVPAAFLIVTSDRSRCFRERCARRGVDMVIHKPVSSARLASAVASLLGGAKLEREGHRRARD
jgi:CheY-like chemotaxis protein